jgi:hypothetical protein
MNTPAPSKQATLLFLIKDQKILLAMKKRGFGKGRWNGVGGKPEKTRQSSRPLFVNAKK